jgi:beta-lactamase class D
MNIFKIAFVVLLFSASTFAEVDFKKAFGDRDGCFIISDVQTGKTITEYNKKRCAERFTPCSSFKIAAALMGIENGIIKNENQIIKWDGVKRGRAEENRDQTPLTWMSDSIKWVTEWIMPKVGEKNIKKYLKDFNYGNRDFSGGLKNAWVTSSLKISAHEQMSFLSKLWKNELPVSTNTINLTKKIIFIKKIGDAELYGKTGTGCLVGHECLDRPGKMIGNFVGILNSNSKVYAFAANASDLTEQERAAGPRLKKTVIEILKDMGLASE